MTRAPHNLTDPAGVPSRIDVLDVLRGLALLGMILVHFHARTRVPSEAWAWYEDWIGWVIWVGVETKAHGIFALLFGAGFAILLTRAEARGERFLGFYLRRMAGLAAFGLVAEAMFGFTILIAYAFGGLWLLLLRRWSSRALLLVAVLAAMSGPLYGFARDQFLRRSAGSDAVSAAAAARQDRTRIAFVRTAAAERSGSYQRVVQARLVGLERYLHPTALLPGANMTLFLLGLLAIRHGIFSDPRRHGRTIRRFMALGAASWASAWILLPRLPGSVEVAGVPVQLGLGLGLVRDQWLALTYAGAMVLLLASRPAWTARLRALGTTGRMALTNYFIQIMVIDLLSASYGLGLTTRPFTRVLATLLLFGAQASCSGWWLARYRYGPLEWIWRAVSYWRLPPLRDIPAARQPSPEAPVG